MEDLSKRIERRIEHFIAARNRSNIDGVVLLSDDHLDSDIDWLAENIAAMLTPDLKPPKPPELPDVTGIGDAFYASKDGKTAVMFRRSSIGNEMWMIPDSPWLSRPEFTKNYRRMLPLRTVTANSIAPMKTNKEKEN